MYDPDKIFVAEIPELLGCVAHGKTNEAALKNVKDVKQLWIKTAMELGNLIPESQNGSLFFL